MEYLGDRIRKERTIRNMTLEKLSELSGLSISLLSQVERGRTQPSISSLKKIARCFDVSVVNLFTDDSGADQNQDRKNGPGENRLVGAGFVEDVKVVRSNRRKSLALPGSSVVYELLTPDLNRQIEVMSMRITAGETSGDEPLVDPPGEKFGLVLKGSLEVTVGSEIHVLGEGDTIYFPADWAHSWRGLGSGPVEAIWVLSPPWF